MNGMNKNEFMETVRMHIADRWSLETMIRQVEKPNRTYTGMEVVRGLVSPVFDMDDMFWCYLRGASMDRILCEIDRVIREEPLPDPELIAGINVWDTVRDRLTIKTINHTRNKDILKKLPHRRPAGDLAQIVYIICTEPGNSGSFAGCAVSDELMETWGLDADELFSAAEETTLRNYPLKIGSINGEPEEGKESTPLFITSEMGVYGFSYVTFTSCIKQIQEYVGDGFFVIPSSIHEAIVIPEEMPASVEDLRKMIREVNSAVVSDEDFLSDEPYYYSVETGFTDCTSMMAFDKCAAGVLPGIKK